MEILTYFFAIYLKDYICEIIANMIQNLFWIQYSMTQQIVLDIYRKTDYKKTEDKVTPINYYFMYRYIRHII